MKQTAVEWLYKALLLDEDNPNYNEWAFAKAKAMEKEQIIDAFEHVDFNLDDGLHYYEKIFKSE